MMNRRKWEFESNEEGHFVRLNGMLIAAILFADGVGRSDPSNHWDWDFFDRDGNQVDDDVVGFSLRQRLVDAWEFHSRLPGNNWL